eukprot:3453150-Amphidinium_carterae.1
MAEAVKIQNTIGTAMIRTKDCKRTMLRRQIQLLSVTTGLTNHPAARQLLLHVFNPSPFDDPPKTQTDVLGGVAL